MLYNANINDPPSGPPANLHAQAACMGGLLGWMRETTTREERLRLLASDLMGVLEALQVRARCARLRIARVGLDVATVEACMAQVLGHVYGEDGDLPATWSADQVAAREQRLGAWLQRWPKTAALVAELAGLPLAADPVCRLARLADAYEWRGSGGKYT